MRMPRFVDVGGHRIRIRRARKVLDSDGTACDGIYIPDDAAIYIDSTTSPDRQEIKLQHELMHTALDVTDVDLKLLEVCGSMELAERLEEDIVIAVTGPFMGTIKQLYRMRWRR